MYSYLLDKLLIVLSAYGISCAVMFVIAFILTCRDYPVMTCNRLQMLLLFSIMWPYIILSNNILAILGIYGAGVVTGLLLAP